MMSADRARLRAHACVDTFALAILVSLAASSLVITGCGQGDASGATERPQIQSISVSPAPVDPGATADIAVRASSGSAPADDVGAADTGATPLPDDLEVTWQAGNSTWSVSGQNNDATITAPDSYGSTTTLTATVTNSDNISASQSIEVTTGDNATPTVGAITASPNPVAPGGAIALAAEATDARGDGLTYTWSTSKDGWSLDTTNGQQVTLQAPDSPAATETVRLEVSDGYGLTASSAVAVQTRPNGPPTIHSLSASPPQIAPGATTTVVASTSDPNDDDLTLEWTASGDWSVESSENSEATIRAPETYGATGRIDLKVTDEHGSATTGQLVVSTHTNSGPNLQSLTASPQSVEKGGTIQLDARASDPEGQTLSYTWSVASPDWTLNPSAQSAELVAPDAPGVSTTVTVEVVDTEGEVASGSIVVSTLTNQSPSLATVTANPPVVSPGATTTVTASATDPDEDSLSYNWSVPSNWSKSGSGASVQITAPNTYGAQAVVTVTVSDGYGGQAAGTTIIQTPANDRPLITSMSAGSTSLVPSSSTQVSVNAVDPNGDPLTYNWTVPSGWSGSSSTDTIQITAPASYSQSGTIQVQVSDGSKSVSQSLTLTTKANQPPTISSLSASPNPVLQNGEMSATVQASDPYGDSLTYQWSIGTGWSVSGTGTSVTIQSPNTGGSSTTLEVVVSDGFGAQTSDTITVSTSSCPSGTGNCDGDVSNGCEVNTDSSTSHCGSCGNTCSGSSPYCNAGSCTSLYTFSGIKNNVSISNLDGWTQCWREDYGVDGQSSISGIQSACSGTKIMLACRQSGSGTLSTLAYADRSEVFQNTSGNTLNSANGVGWYFRNDYSWGYAPPGDTVDLNSCDVNQQGDSKRLCWHLQSNNELEGGWRCGGTTSLNGSSSWERLVFSAP